MSQAVPGSTAGKPVIGLCGACASGLVSRAPGRLRDPPWGHYDPCARSSLHGDAPLARLRKRRTGAGKCRSGAPRGAPSPRHGPGHLRRLPEMDPTARRVTGAAASAPAPVGALLPSFFRGAENGQRGARPLSTGPAERWLFDNRIGNLAQSEPRAPTLPWRGRVDASNASGGVG